LNALSGIYSRVTRARRAWYRAPHRQRHLEQPVISVGNLATGGSGKTPVVAAVTRLLQEMGETPSILSRGYGRRSTASLVIVSEGNGPLVDVTVSGDEPQMLARSLRRVPILVSADRHAAGRVAETRLGATVHVLDDGFQHVRLARDADLLLVSASDLDEAVLPVGRLREPLEAASVADAVLVPGSPGDQARVRAALEPASAFDIVAATDTLRLVQPFGERHDTSRAARVIAVAGIARPQRFVEGLAAAGFDVAKVVTFRDHHWFDAADVRRIEDAARAADCFVIVTTEKDAVRLQPVLTALPGSTGGAGRVEWLYQPYEVGIKPDSLFRTGLGDRVALARQRRPRSA
jgi:tetraacyldisaccharide 4'-kinase